MVAAMIMLAYGLNRFMEIPARVVELQLPGLFLNFEINDKILTAFLVAGLAAAGTDWLLHDHPAVQKQNLLPHLLLPSVTALVIGVPLNQLTFSTNWWLGLLSGTAAMVIVVVAEYIAVDADDVRQPLAAAVLSAVAYATFLVLAVTLRAAGIRLLFLLPALIIATWLVSLRVLNLRLHGLWTVYESAIVALVVVQLAAAAHYWPLAPVRYGLLLLGPAYALTGLFSGLIEEKQPRSLWVAPAIVLGITWLGAVLFP